jgi:hypothetical protein
MSGVQKRNKIVVANPHKAVATALVKIPRAATMLIITLSPPTKDSTGLKHLAFFVSSAI